MSAVDGSGPARRPRVVLLSEQRLVGDAVRMALSGRQVDVVMLDWPSDVRPLQALKRAIVAHRPHAGVVFGDLENPEHRAQARQLVSTVPLRWALVVSHHDDVAWGDLVAAGAALLPTSISIDDLSSSLTRLVTGADLMPCQTREEIVREWQVLRDQMERVSRRLARLTPRESQVLEMLSQGRSVKDIAAHGEVSEATVRTQVKAVLRKLEVGTQLAAVALARGARPDGLAPRRGAHPGP